MKKILDNFEWEEDYFNLIWNFQKENKVFVVDEETKSFVLSPNGEEMLKLEDSKIGEIAYGYFLKHSCCSEDIKKLVLKDLVKSYPCYIDVRYFVELSKKVVSDLSHLLIKEDLNLETTFSTIYYLLYNLGLAQKINVRREHLNITSIRLNHEGYYFVTGEKKVEIEDEDSEKINIENGNLIMDIDTNYDDLKHLFEAAEKVTIKDRIKIKLKEDRFDYILNLNFKDSVLNEKINLLYQKFLSVSNESSVSSTSEI